MPGFVRQYSKRRRGYDERVKPSILAASLVLLVAVGGLRAFTDGPSSIRFTNVTDSARLQFRHVKGGSGQHYYPEQFGAGVAFLDYNRDGFLDIFFVQGAPLPGFGQ